MHEIRCDELKKNGERASKEMYIKYRVVQKVEKTNLLRGDEIKFKYFCKLNITHVSKNLIIWVSRIKE